MSIDADILGEAQRLLQRAEAAAVPLRALGGAAVSIRLGERMPEGLRREIADIDFATLKRSGRAVEAMLTNEGYAANATFNSLHGARRLLFYDSDHHRQVDVFVGDFEMCHAIPLEGRLMSEPHTLPLAELALTKLQIFKLNPKDMKDLCALLAVCGVAERDGDSINAARIADLCARDWGLYRTTTLNLQRLRDGHPGVDLSEAQHERLSVAIERLADAIEQQPKSGRWRMRARVGERLRWYEDPDEVQPGGY